MYIRYDITMKSMDYEHYVRNAFNADNRGGDPTVLADADYFRGFEYRNDFDYLLIVRTAVCYAM